MRRTFVDGRRRSRLGVRSLAELGELLLQLVDLPGHFKHGLVLFQDVALQPGKSLFEQGKPVVTHRGLLVQQSLRGMPSVLPGCFPAERDALAESPEGVRHDGGAPRPDMQDSRYFIRRRECLPDDGGTGGEACATFCTAPEPPSIAWSPLARRLSLAERVRNSHATSSQAARASADVCRRRILRHTSNNAPASWIR